jgi:ABC-type multidrug transport system ATPase subunit
VQARQELWGIIEPLKKQGMTILLITHHLDEAERLCSRIDIIKNGRIAREGYCLWRDNVNESGSHLDCRRPYYQWFLQRRLRWLRLPTQRRC